ncbi:DUF4232 domain-containing protein [Streptomyces cyaneofuscatus]|uniref:DUF4232 domain-containing protein n=1 Tax=Streptomyces cyaneofuscatus TaxID=66883 RepID=UPI003446C05B
MGERVRGRARTWRPASVVVLLTALTGCSGFLVPAGEGEREPTPTAQAATPPPPPPSATPRPIADAPPQDPDPSPTPTPTPTPTATEACPASGAVVTMGEVQALLMSRAVVLTLTNCGSAPYRVDGYPSVQALGEDGERLPVKVNPAGSKFGRDQGPEALTLKPGATVKSMLAWVSTQEGGELVMADALELAAAPDAGARVYPLEGHDVRYMDELNITAWRSELPE